MSADSPRRSARGIPAIVPPQVVSDRSIIDSVAGFINDVTLNNQPQCDPKDTITWARFETAADISDTRYCDDWELEGNVAPPLLLILGYGQGVQVWAIPANGEAVEVLSWRHGIVSALRVLPTPSYAENGRADEPIDTYADKRPLMAICDGTTPAGSNPQFCAVNFVSLKTGAQVKTIKFKNPVLDILANRSSIVITFHERIAVFDARSLEDRLSVTTCFPSPGINPNPVALGSRWMAYSENKLLHSKRSGGGCDGDGVSSYTATVLNAAKSFGKGLRELGEQVAAGLTGTTGSGGSSKSSSFDSATGDVRQGGVVTILDIKHPIKDVSPTSGTPISINGSDPIVAHFIAHPEAVVAMEFDNSGMMLLTADRRGHDFHLFRIQPHPVGSSLASVHHIYVLHRGDTSAKVQNITFSLDSRWVAVSTLRGTTHVFPVTPYGGPAGVRTHTSLHVVNKLSRFHRSAGLTADGRSSSPISHSDSTNFSQMLMPYHNPTLPPFPRPTVVLPLAQLRQPFALGSPPGSAVPSSYGKTSNTRQRLSSLSDDNGKPLSVCAVFAKSRSWLLDPPNSAREAPHKIQRKAVDSLFVMAGHGALIQYDLDTKLATSVAKEKICDDTPIELDVEAKAQWNLGRKDGSLEIVPPLTTDNWLIKDKNSCMLIDSTRQYDDSDDRCDSWLSQVEIITHAGPHRRLWMGPQFVFKTYNTPSGSNLSHIDVEAVEIGVSSGPSNTGRPGRSSPLNMPLTATGRSAVPVLIESGSYSSIEQSPKLMDRFRHEHMNSDFSVAHGDNRLKEDLADAMRESPSVSHKDSGGQPQRRRPSAASSSRATTSSSPSSSPKASGSGGVSSTSSSSSAATMVGGCGDVYNSSSSQYESLESLIQQQQEQQQQQMKTISIENVVNPLGTVTTITGSCDSELDTDDVMKGISAQSYVIHENCDESLFRPVVAIFCDENSRLDADRLHENSEFTKPPEAIGNKLIVPVIEKAVDLELTKKESLKNRGRRQQQQIHHQVKEESDDEVVKFNITDLNRKQKIEKKKQVKDDVKKPFASVQKPNIERDEKLIAKQTQTPVEIGSVVSQSSKEKQKKQVKEETPKAKSLDTVVKSKSDKGRKSAEKEVVVDNLEHFETQSPSTDESTVSNVKNKSTKIRKSVERDVLSDEGCKKNVPEKSLKSEKSNKGRRSVDKEISPEPLVMEKKSLCNDSNSKTSKSVEKNLIPKEDSSKNVSEETLKSKSSKRRKSDDKEILSEEESFLETHSYHFKNEKPSSIEKTTTKTRKSEEKDSLSDEESRGSDKISKGPSKQKTTKGRKSIEKDVLSDIVSTLETHFDHFESETTSTKIIDSDKKKKSSNVERSIEKEIVPVCEAPSSTNSSRKSSVIELKTSMEDEPMKKTRKERKNEEKVDADDEVGTKFSKSNKNKENPEEKANNTPVLTKPSLEDFEDEKPIEFKRMTVSSTVSSTKTSNKNSKSDKNAHIKPKTASDSNDSRTAQSVTKKRAKSPEECASDVVDGKPSTEITSSKKNTPGESKKKSRQDSKASGIPLSVELSNASDLADSLLDFRHEKAEVENISSKVYRNQKTISPADKYENEKDETLASLPVVSLEEDLPSPDLPSPPAEFLASAGMLSEATDTIITVEEKDSDALVEVSPDTKSSSLSSEKSTVQSKKKSKASVKKADKTSTEIKNSKPIDDSLRESVSRSNSVVPIEKMLKKPKSTKVVELSDNTPNSENDLTSSKITIEPMEVDTFLSDLIDSQSLTKTKSSSTTNNSRPVDSPKKSTTGSPLKFVDAFGDNFATPVIPLKKEKSNKKKPTCEKPEASEPSLKSYDGIQFFDSFLREGTTSSVEPSTAPWKPISTAENKKTCFDIDYPDLGKPIKSKKTQSPPLDKKEIFFTVDIRDEKNENKPSKSQTNILDDLPILKPLEDLSMDFLPPLATLEPLEGTDENMSLINFESPLQETSKLIKQPEIEVEKVSPQFPKGFPADNIIFALCGSLHYENENSGKPIDSPLTLSFSDSTAHTTAEYKSLTENDDQYLSLEQSSQENAPSTSSSTCEDVTEAAYSSSGGGGVGDKVNIATSKMKNKQRRKKQLITAAEDDDEELRPLISKNDDVNLMASSMTASTGKPENKSDMASVKNKPLPPLDSNNQVNSDSSSSDQAMTSEDTDVAVATVKSSNKSAVEDDADLAASSIQSPQQPQSQSQQQLPNSSKKKLKRRKR